MMIVPSLESERLCCSPSIHCNTSEHRRSSIHEDLLTAPAVPWSRYLQRVWTLSADVPNTL